MIFKLIYNENLTATKFSFSLTHLRGFFIQIQSSLVKLAMRKKRALLNQGIVRRDTFWDKILAPIQGKLGGRVHTIVCGAAPLNPEEKVENYFTLSVAMSIAIYTKICIEIYGIFTFNQSVVL